VQQAGADECKGGNKCLKEECPVKSKPCVHARRVSCWVPEKETCVLLLCFGPAS
jgi:hypothetical protein